MAIASAPSNKRSNHTDRQAQTCVPLASKPRSFLLFLCLVRGDKANADKHRAPAAATPPPSRAFGG
jgi:hypothetical protein